MKASCASAGLAFFFWRIRLRQPVCSYTPITIIRKISWASLSVHKIYFYYHIFVRIFFSSVIDASIKLVRSFPWEWNKTKTKQNKTKQNKTNTQTKKRRIYRSIFKNSTKKKKKKNSLKIWSSETRGNLAFYVTAWSEYVHLIFLGIFLSYALHWL